MTDARVVMFVLNPVRFDRRVLREAASLAAAGIRVTVYGTDDRGERCTSREQHPEGFEIVRVPLPGQSSLWRHTSPMATVEAGLISTDRAHQSVAGPRRSAANRAASRPWLPGGTQARWLLNARRRWWGWGRAVLADVDRADVYHGHDLAGLGVAIYARRRYGGRLVYDSHDLFLEAGANASRPRPIRHLIRTIERRWYRQADLIVTVNRALADRLTATYGSKPMAVVHNCVPRWDPDAVTDDPLRRRAGIPSDTPVVLYHGGFTANRGLGLLMRAMLAPGLERCHLVLLGYGPMREELERLAGAEQYAGRVHVLDPVPPEELDRHVAAADVCAMVNQPASDNELLSTPNKLFESIAAGVPVVTSDFPMRREIVLDGRHGRLGAVCDPTDVDSIAAALRDIVNAHPENQRDLRERCLRAARDRWNWEHESRELLVAYTELLDESTIPIRQPLSDRPA